MKSQITIVQTGTHTHPQAAVTGWLVAGLFILTIAIATLPIFSYQFLSINDYLNHLARSDVLLRRHSDLSSSPFFITNWKMLPNLAFDVWILSFGQILPVAIAGKLFVVATLALLLSGVIFLHRVTFNKWSLWPFLAVILLYNRPFLSGILNFLFGVGLWLHVLSLWIYLRPARPLIRASALSAGALAVFFAHLFAFGILAVTIAAYELVIFASSNRPFLRRVGDLIVGGIPFIPAIAILVLISPHSNASAIVRYRDL